MVLQAEKSVQESYLAKTEALNEQIKAMGEMNQVLLDKVHKAELAAINSVDQVSGKNKQAAPGQTDQHEGEG